MLQLLLPPLLCGRSHGPLAGQQVSLRGADPCVRLLNASGSIGCATPANGALAPLHLLSSMTDVEALAQQPPDGEVIVALHPSLFAPAALSTLRDALGAALAGVLVLHSATLPHGIPSPAPASLPGEGQHAWNGAGAGLSFERFPFGIVLLDEADSKAVLAAAGSGAVAAAQDLSASAPASPGGGRPLVELRYPMTARVNAARCLAQGTCLPIGGQSVWGALRPRTATQPTPGSGAGGTPLLAPGQRAVGLAVGIDASSFFHEHAPGAYEAVAPLVALLAAVDAIVTSPSLVAQLPTLPVAPVFFLFTAEAWGRTGSRRFLADVHNFTCTDAPPPPPPDSGGDGRGRGLPALPTCAWPPKSDLRFESLRGDALSALVQIGPVGSAEAADVEGAGGDSLYVHAPAAGTLPFANAAVDALLLAASPNSSAVLAAATQPGLPPGPARTFLEHSAAVRGGGGPPAIATLTDFDAHYRGGGRFGSRFDTLDGLSASRVCAASTVAARAWWGLAGGVGAPTVNCSTVTTLLRCLLPSAAAPGGGSAAAGDAGGVAADGSPCELAADLGVEGDLGSRYAGVFMASAGRASMTTTARFAQRYLQRALNATCMGLGAACEPVVVTHDAYSPAIEPDRDTGTWRAIPPIDPDAPMWAESNWPAEMHTTIYPHGAPRTAESVALLASGSMAALLAYGVVLLSRRQYKQALLYKRL